jgi:hypothetical protein
MSNAGSAPSSEQGGAERRGKGRGVGAAARRHGASALHPGWVKTDMGGASADIDAGTSVTGMRVVIERSGPQVSGHFDYTGKGRLPGDRIPALMLSAQSLGLFVLACSLLAITPGPNLFISRVAHALSGRRAGIVSLAGTSFDCFTSLPRRSD